MADAAPRRPSRRCAGADLLAPRGLAAGAGVRERAPRPGPAAVRHAGRLGRRRVLARRGERRLPRVARRHRGRDRLRRPRHASRGARPAGRRGGRAARAARRPRPAFHVVDRRGPDAFNREARETFSTGGITTTQIREAGRLDAQLAEVDTGDSFRLVPTILLFALWIGWATPLAGEVRRRQAAPRASRSSAPPSPRR